MKFVKRISSVLLALVLVLSLATTAFAANDTKHTITINNSASGYEYNAYQIFKGDIDATSGQLTNIEWGAGVKDSAALLTELKTLDAFKDCVTVVDVATVLNGTEFDNATAQAFADIVAKHVETVAGTSNYADGKYTIEVSGDGYYLILNTKVPEATEDTATGSYTRYILKVVGDVEVKHKGEVPSVEKKIVEGEEEKDYADFNIGDKITFTLTGTLPSNYADYEVYNYVFTDTLSAGLTYNADAKVYVVNEGSDPIDVTKSFNITPETTQVGGTLTVSCNDITEIASISASSKIVVEYTVTLNNAAEIGNPGNPNTVKLTFSNNPNAGGTGSNGETPEDKVIVFTYELDVTKLDGKDDSIKLKDAQFILWNSDKSKIAKVADGVLVEWVDKANVTANTDGTYPAEYTLTSDANGFFKVVGLDAGTYYLQETKAPTGYNLLTDPIQIVISANVETGTVTDLKITVGEGEEAVTADGNAETGVVTTTVLNNSGATLPETGGMGTTLFYIAGGVLVLAAVVLLVTKRRMSVEM